MQSLDIISVNIWDIIISLANLLVMFLILRRFLFKPVQRMFDMRRKQVEDIYAEAREERSQAEDMKQEYETRMASAREEADGLVRNAVQTAQRRSDAIVQEAKSEATHLKQKAESEIEQEKRKAYSELMGEISGMAADIAGRMVEREINPDDHRELVEEFIKSAGEAS